MNIDLKKIEWFPGKAALQPQLMTLRIRNKNAPDEEINYTTIADDLLVYTDGTILNPPVIKDLEENTEYIFRILNNDPAGGQYDTTFTTPATFKTEPLTKSYYPDSELTYTGGSGFRDAMLPPKTGAYYSLEYTRADWFGAYGEAQPSGAWEWGKKADLSGIKLGEESSITLNMDDAFASEISTQYTFGVHFYVAAEELPATGTWHLFSFSSFPNGDGMRAYVNCDTKKVHWRQQRGTVIQEIISANTINTGAWNQVLVFRASDIATSRMWLNSSDTFTGAFTAAGAPAIQFLPNGLSVGAAGGIFSKIYYSTAQVDNNIAAKYQQPPYPVGILEEYYNPANKFSIPGKNMIMIENSRIVFTLPPDVPPGRKWFYVEDSNGTGTRVEVNILPLSKIQYPVALNFGTEGGGGDDLKSLYYPTEKGWGGANGGVSPKHIYMQDDGLLVLEAHGDYYDGLSQGFSEDGKPKYHDMPNDPSTPLSWNTRVGAVITSKDYYGYGRFVVEAQLPAEMGVAPAFWVSHYAKVYPQDPRFEQMLGRGLHGQGDYYNGDYYVVEKNETGMELPSHNASVSFYSVEEMIGTSYNIVWAGQKVAVQEDPDPANNGTWQLNNAAAPNQLESWTKISNEIQLLFQPRKDNVKCRNGIGELGDGLGFWSEDEFLTMLTSIGKNVWDGEFHEFRFDWYADRVEFYVDGDMVQVNRNYVPDVPGRWKIGLWFPSFADRDRPWQHDPYAAWAGPVANWKYQKMLIKKIAYTPFSDTEAGGTNRLAGETYPFDGLQREYPLPPPA